MLDLLGLLGGSSGGWLKRVAKQEAQMSASSQSVQYINLKVEYQERYPERYSGDVTCVSWKIRMT